MHVLVTWGSKHDGAENAARLIAETLEQEGLSVSALPPKRAMTAFGFDAAIIGGGLHTNRWPKEIRKVVERRERDLLHVPVWFFSSGSEANVPPTKEVAIFMERVGAQTHVTFGENEARIRAWARAIARAIPSARPRPALAQPGRSIGTLIAHAIIAWAVQAAILGAVVWATSTRSAFAAHAIAAPIVFAFVARHYFRYRGAHEPLPVAVAFTAIAAALDAAIIAAILRSFSWLPLALVFLVTWIVGAVTAMGPLPRERTASG